MSALSPEARERLLEWLARCDKVPDNCNVDNDREEGPTFGDLRALLEDSDALAASEAADRAVVVAMEAAKAALEAVTRERDVLVDMFQSLRAEFYCASCGKVSQTLAEMYAHVEACPNHPIAKLRAQVSKLRDDNATLRGAVVDMRWVQPTYNGSPSCAFCGQQRHLHTQPCDVDRILAATAPEPREDGGSDEASRQ